MSGLRKSFKHLSPTLLCVKQAPCLFWLIVHINKKQNLIQHVFLNEADFFFPFLKVT
jgi:hypothetical protein